MEWYKHYIDLYDADTSHLSLAEDGAYSRILRWIYKHERAVLPLDEKALASICRISVTQWRRVAENVIPLFEQREGPTGIVLVQKRSKNETEKFIARRADDAERQQRFRKHNDTSNSTLKPKKPQEQKPAAQKKKTAPKVNGWDPGESVKPDEITSRSTRPGSKPRQFTKAEKKEAWKAKIIEAAQRTMSADRCATFIERFINDDPRATPDAEHIDKMLKAEKSR